MGLPAPKLEDGKDLFEALREMGDLRGSYMPRLRFGRYIAWCEKDGEPKFMRKFETKARRAAFAATMKGKGYTVTISR